MDGDGDSNVFSELLSASRVFRNRGYLSSKIVPEDLPHREKEIKQLAFNFSFALKGSNPSNMFICGSAGCGKTATIKKVLKDLNCIIDEHSYNVVTSYATCEPYETKTMIAITDGVGMNLPREGLSFVGVRDRFFEYVKDKRVIIILDEIDNIVKSSTGGKSLLYHLTRSDNITLVGISNVVWLMNHINDEKILSSWDPKKMTFTPYNVDELRDILNYRARQAFYEGVISEDVIDHIAVLAHKRGGDARYALDLLTATGDVAVIENSDRVYSEYIKRAIDMVEEEFIKTSTRNLKQPEKTLLMTVCIEDGISPSEAYKKANNIFESIDGNTMGSRRWAQHRRSLELQGYIEAGRRGKGKGKGQEHHLYFIEESDKQMVLNTLLNDLASEMDESKIKDIVKQNFGIQVRRARPSKGAKSKITV